MTRVACLQLSPVIGDLDGNAARAAAAIDGAIAAGADVIVLPELCLSGYVFSGPEEAAALAVGADHPILAGWARAAAEHDVIIAGGFAELGADGRLYNSGLLCAGDAPPTVYRKLHLWDREKLVFHPGSAPPPVLSTRVGQIALVVCYDLEFPELTRGLALAGTELLLVPTNWPWVPRPDGERAPEVVIAMATARANRMAIACADRCGTERGQDWNQGTTIVGADGWVAAERTAPGMVFADLDLTGAADKRLTEHADLFADRRPEVYARLDGAPAGSSAS